LERIRLGYLGFRASFGVALLVELLEFF
jgi:hypothetical protein